MRVPGRHFVNGHPLKVSFPEGMQTGVFSLGCFWAPSACSGTRRGCYSTVVGYAGGNTPNPTYEEVCSGCANHTEAVLVVFDPNSVAYEELLKVFWEGHDPAQGVRQGNDAGTRSTARRSMPAAASNCRLR